MIYRWRDKAYWQVTTGDLESMTPDELKAFNAEWLERHLALVEAWKSSGRHEDEDLLDSRTYGEHGL